MKNVPKKNILDDFISDYDDTRMGKMFGYPAYYVGRSMFACLYEGKVGLKLPESEANEARGRNEISEFQPYGKPKMREWIQFDFDSEGKLCQYKHLIDAAIEYAKARNSKKREVIFEKTSVGCDRYRHLHLCLHPPDKLTITHKSRKLNVGWVER